jgi:hypothetical protein
LALSLISPTNSISAFSKGDPQHAQ